MNRRAERTLRNIIERTAMLLIIVSLLFPLANGPVSYGQDDAPLDVPFGPVLFVLPTQSGASPTDLPPTTVLHARLEEPGADYWVASGSATDAATLAQAGWAVTVVDADAGAAIYYIADATAPGAAQLAAESGRLLWQGETHLLVATDAEQELALVETLPMQGVAISLLSPLPLVMDDAPVHAAEIAPAAPTAVDPAVAVLLAQITPEELRNLVSQISGETPAMVGGAPVTINTRYTFAPRLRDAEQFVYEYYQRLRLDVRYSPWTYGQYSGRNVVAEVRGSRQPQRVLLVGGHLDSTSNLPYANAPGADDNATGTAATLTLARLLAAYQPELTVRFIHFTGEEQGQWGSKVYAAALRRAGEQVVGFINLDMIGWDGNGDRVVEIHTARGPKSNALADQYLERNNRYGLGLTFERKTTTASRFSDHSPFWDNDYASFLVIENFFDDARPRDRNPYYHNTGDIASRIDYDYVVRIARVTLATLVELAGYALESAPGAPTPTHTPTPTFTPTATPTSNPDNCTNLLLNGDFETSGGWQFGSTPYPGRYVSAPVFSAARAVQLGIPIGVANRRAYSTVFQRVTIPANAETPVFLRYVEQTHGAADNVDYRETLLLNSNYGYVARLSRSSAAGDGVWRERLFDLTAYRGRTLVVYFNVYNDGAGSQMWSYLDRVELGSCVRASGAETPTPESTATPEATETPISLEPTATPEATETPVPLEPTATPEPAATPALLSLAPSQLYLGELFHSTAVTLSVQLNEQRAGFAWEAVVDAPWLTIERLPDEAEAAMVVELAQPLDMEDGVYTATVRVTAVLEPETIVVEAPVLYVRSAVHSLFLPSIVSESAPE